ncbi:MAG: histidinol dehydrogenase [Mangrovibacterium sp.]
MKQYSNMKPEQWAEILKRPELKSAALHDKVMEILSDVKKGGDAMLKKYTEKFDGVVLSDLMVSEAELEESGSLLELNLKQAIEKAAGNILKFHSMQMSDVHKVETMHGVRCWQKSLPIEKIGLYVPGGSAPLFSTVLMLALPAKIAGCSEIVLCTPPNEKGGVHPAILFAAKLCGVTKVFKVGGAHAIAAMAYGTESIPKVYKIFGPGNQYVMTAKQLLSACEVAIDMPAGASEVAVMVDETAIPAFVASDLLSQAEHGIDSQVVLVASSEEVVKAVWAEVLDQIKVLPRKEIALQSLANGVAMVMQSEQEMIDVVNEYAPEHLIISMKNYMQVAERIVNAGSVFLGNYTPESAGDYASGTNHTLPTNGWARAYSGVGLDSFCKKISFQEITKEGISNLGETIELMAEAEGLWGHKYAVELRLKSLE